MTQVNNNCCVPILLAPISTSANNVYMAWTNNDTGHWKVLLANSGDGGRTFKTIVLSAPNLRGHVVHENVQIAASGSAVYITWGTNQTGTLVPVLRASNDGGNTFGKTLILNFDIEQYRSLTKKSKSCSLVFFEVCSNPFTLPHFLDLFVEVCFHSGTLPTCYYQIVTRSWRMF